MIQSHTVMGLRRPVRRALKAEGRNKQDPTWPLGQNKGWPGRLAGQHSAKVISMLIFPLCFHCTQSGRCLIQASSLLKPLLQHPMTRLTWTNRAPRRRWHPQQNHPNSSSSQHPSSKLERFPNPLAVKMNITYQGHIAGSWVSLWMLCYVCSVVSNSLWAPWTVAH